MYGQTPTCTDVHPGSRRDPLLGPLLRTRPGSNPVPQDLRTLGSCAGSSSPTLDQLHEDRGVEGPGHPCLCRRPRWFPLETPRPDPPFVLDPSRLFPTCLLTYQWGGPESVNVMSKGSPAPTFREPRVSTSTSVQDSVGSRHLGSRRLEQPRGLYMVVLEPRG